MKAADQILKAGSRTSNDAETVFMDHSGTVAPGRAGGAPPDNTGVWAQMN